MAESPADYALGLDIPTTHKSSNSSNAWVVGLVVMAVVISSFLACYYKDRKDKKSAAKQSEDGIENRNASERDLESGTCTKRPVSKLEVKAQFKKGGGQGDMVSGYDKRVSSAKVNPKYYENFLRTKYGKGTDFYYGGDVESGFSSSEGERVCSNKLKKVRFVEPCEGDRKFGSKGETVRSNKNKKVRFGESCEEDCDTKGETSKEYKEVRFVDGVKEKVRQSRMHDQRM